MGLLFASGRSATPAQTINRVSDELLHKLGCRSCPLNKAKLISPKMPATGSDTPLIYILGEAPGATEDREGEQFVGASGDFLRPRIPRDIRNKIRWNNVINCVPGDTLVSSPGRVTKVFRRWFTGRLITPVTRSGRVFSTTENHPVLTSRGWVLASQLVNGDYLVCSTDSDWETISTGPHIYNSPTQISEVFDSLCETGISQRVVGSSIDFHGDGSNSEIDIVSSDIKLGYDRHIPTDKEIEQVAFTASAHGHSRILAESQSSVPVSYFNTGPNESVPNRSGTTSKTNGNFIDALTVKVRLDKIVDIKVRGYSGHVFNLETTSGWYIANNTIIHNCHPENNRNPEKIEVECCRPRIETDIEETRPAAIFGMGGFALSWAGKPSGVELWRGRKFPIQVGNHTCWFYVMHHPSFMLHMQKNSWKSDDEVAFDLDLRTAIAEVKAGLPKPVVHSPDRAKSNITCIQGRSKGDLGYLLDFLEYAGTCDVTGVDYETQNVRPYRKDSEILTAAVSVADETVAFAFRHPKAGWSDKNLRTIDGAWVRFLQSPAIKAVHNLSFEMEWTAYYYGNDLLRGVAWEDTMTQAYVLDERVGEQKPGALALEFLCLQYFGLNIKKMSQGFNKENMKAEPLSALLPYNGIDAKYHRELYLEQEKRIKAEGLTKVYSEKLRQVPTAVLTQLIGIPIDRAENDRLHKEYEEKIKLQLESIQEIKEAKDFYRLTGKKFNPGSPQDVIIILRDILKNRTGQEGTGWTTKESVLRQLDLPITNEILAYRKAAKIKGTYVDPFREGASSVYPGDLLHQNLGTCLTETGRLQSDEPNCQNWPVRSAEGKKARKQVKAKVVASFDYGQIDARIIACGSRDRNYCKAIFEDYDIHMEWAERLAHHYPEFIGGKKNLNDKEVMKKFRSNKVKSEWVFASFYGAALRTTAVRFGVDESVLKPLFEEFWKQFADVKVWQEALVKQFNDYGYVQLFDGLRRRAPLGRGQIINSGVQGATNRVVMLGMNRLSEMENDLYQARFQIHDDLTFLFDSENDFADCMPTIIDTMLDGSAFEWFIVPLVVEVKTGKNWAEMSEIGTYRSDKRLGWPKRHPDFT